MTELCIIAAVTDGGVIGNNGTLPWRQKTDIQRFSQLTKEAGWVIMGRKTHESILARLGKPLPSRKSIIITRNKSYKADQCIVVHSLLEAINAAQEAKRVFIIGGAEIYKLALPSAESLYITHIHDAGSITGDTYFPSIPMDEWKSASCLSSFHGPNDEYDYSFKTYVRRFPRNDIFTNTGSTRLVHIHAARNPEQRLVMEGYQQDGICPFCPEYFLPDHKQAILHESKYWHVTRNQWPYKHTRNHFLLILKQRHIDDIKDLTDGEKLDLFDQYEFLKTRYGITGCALVIRTGDITQNGSSVAHLHVHIIESDMCGDGHEPVRVKIG